MRNWSSLLKQVKKVDKDIPVLIRSDEKATLDRLTFVWDACRKVGLTNTVCRRGRGERGRCWIRRERASELGFSTR
jgi:hypothetical protein